MEFVCDLMWFMYFVDTTVSNRSLEICIVRLCIGVVQTAQYFTLKPYLVLLLDITILGGLIICDHCH